MPKKIENPLTEGLISKIYLSAFSKYKTAYRIGKEEIDVRSGQVIREINREKYSHLFDRKIISETNKPIRSKVEPFLKEIEKELKKNKVMLSFEEKEQLKEYLDGPFRKAMDSEYFNIDYSESINAYQELVTLLKAVTSIEYSSRMAVKKLRINELRKRNIMEDVKGGFKRWNEEAGSPIPWQKEIIEDLSSFSDSLFEKLENLPLSGSRGALEKVYKRNWEKMFDVLNEKISKSLSAYLSEEK